jgi:hypothetical protein
MPMTACGPPAICQAGSLTWLPLRRSMVLGAVQEVFHRSRLAPVITVAARQARAVSVVLLLFAR